MVVAPDGVTVAMPTVDHSLRFANVDRCVGKTVMLPRNAAGLDFAPDGRSIAVGLQDRSVVVVSVPRLD
jgi:hypothetical protein